jgi:hypothetical protein
MTDDLVKRLRKKAFRTETGELLDEAADRIRQLEVALRSVLQYRLTDETWVKLGFDPKKIRLEFDAARKALERKDD